MANKKLFFFFVFLVHLSTLTMEFYFPSPNLYALLQGNAQDSIYEDIQGLRPFYETTFLESDEDENIGIYSKTNLNNYFSNDFSSEKNLPLKKRKRYSYSSSQSDEEHSPKQSKYNTNNTSLTTSNPEQSYAINKIIIFNQPLIHTKMPDEQIRQSSNVPEKIANQPIFINMSYDPIVGYTETTPTTNTKSKKTITKNEQIRQYSEIIQQLYPCTICNKHFSLEESLIKHTTKHTNAKFQCTECDKSYMYKGDLTRHKKIIHLNKKNYKCTECPKSFAEKGTLDAHIRRHTGEKPFQCTICDKSFIQKNHLITHIRNHTGKKLFQCTECDKSFIQKSHLNDHMKKHTNEKPFQCIKCKTYLSTQFNLNRHIKKDQCLIAKNL